IVAITVPLSPTIQPLLSLRKNTSRNHAKVLVFCFTHSALAVWRQTSEISKSVNIFIDRITFSGQPQDFQALYSALCTFCTLRSFYSGLPIIYRTLLALAMI